jgi:hypothetical protein
MRMILAAAAICCALPAAPAGAQTPPPDTVFTPIKPCRAFNTATSAKITGNTYKTFQIGGPGSLVSQGGPAAGCGVPASATAVAISLTGIAPASTGYATAFAYGTQLPNTYTVQVSTIVPATAGAIVAVAEGKMNVFVNKTMHVIGDVTGYYAPNLYAYVQESGILYRGSRVISLVRNGTGKYTITFDRDIGTCAANVTSDYSPYFMSADISADRVTVYTYNKLGEPTNYYFFLSVHC